MSHHPSNLNKFLGIPSKIWLMLWTAYALLLVFATHYPQVKLPDIPNSDKWIHTAAYFFVMTFWTAWRLSRYWDWRSVFFGGMLMMLFGIIDEITQPIFNRHADFYDWLCDCAGICIAGMLYGLIFLICKNHEGNGSRSA